MREEFEFYIRHSSEINKRYGGKHIAIIGKKVVASDDSVKDILKIAKGNIQRKRQF